MRTFKLGTTLVGALVVLGVTSTGCVADRPARNGVFNENQYVRKDFLIQGVDPNGNAVGTDPGWMMRASIVEASTPNIMGGLDMGPGGTQTDVQWVRWRVTQDKLQMLSMLQYSNPVTPYGTPNTTGTTESVENAWPATNVDLKYRVNLDGETTNFYEENQELDWQVRQWVKLQFDKNDFSDLAPFGPSAAAFLNLCTDVVDVSTTLVTDSFIIEQNDPSTIADDYMEFTTQVTMPIIFSDATCVQAFGPELQQFLELGRTAQTFNVKYSFKRATPTADLTYKPLVVAEKDPILVKYGPILHDVFDYDAATNLVAANQYVVRHDPTKPIVWYFDQNFPAQYKTYFTDPKTGVAALTNAVLEKANVKARVSFNEWNGADPVTGEVKDRYYGDVRYNFLYWISDINSGNSYYAATPWGFDPRTGENINTNIAFNDQPVKDTYVYRVDAFLTSIGASSGIANPFQTGSCTTGDARPIVDATMISQHNASSTLFTKMQQYLGLHGPDPTNDHLGPQDFIATQDADFYNAYYALTPFEIFGDPDENAFVTREGGAGVYGPADQIQHLKDEATFQQLASTISNGKQPYDSAEGGQGVANAAAFVNQMRDLNQSHNELANEMRFAHYNSAWESLDDVSFERVMQHASQQCVNGQWQTREQWEQSVIDYFWRSVIWHEFGHSMGLYHNFMGSVDKPNFPPSYTDSLGNTQYPMYSSSIMEYPAQPADLFIAPDWGPYDKGAIAWIYANSPTCPAGQTGICTASSQAKDNPSLDAQALANKSRSGQANATYPYVDPLGFCNTANGDVGCTQGTEHQFLHCTDSQEKYTPLCRKYDLGTTPSEIIANDIDNYEWQYQWRNFRAYHKVWNESNYSNAVNATLADVDRFLPQWYFDWNPGNLATTLYRIGITPPAGAPSANDYYTQLTQKFLYEMSTMARMVAAFDEALIQQAAGERPYATVYDTFYGDETQQGIILDKYFAVQNFIGLRPINNYNPNNIGNYLSTFASYDFDDSFQSVTETAATSMIGTQYAAFPYFIPTAVALFAQDTHNPAFLESSGNRIEAKDWIGGWTFSRQADMITFFQNLAVQSAYTPTTPPAGADASCTQVITSIPACAGAGTGCAGLSSCCATLVGAAFTECNANLTALTTPVTCSTLANCAYDVTDPVAVPKNPQTAQFVGPDGLNYIYMLIPSRNEWVVARADRDITTYKLIVQYNTDLIANHDDGTNGIYYLDEYPIKYTIDSYQYYEGQSPN